MSGALAQRLCFALLPLTAACASSAHRSARSAEATAVIVSAAACSSPASAWTITGDAAEHGNVLQLPLMAAFTDTAPTELRLYDLRGARTLWRVPTKAGARPELLHDVVVTTIDGDFVGFDLRNGSLRFRTKLPSGDFLGASQVGESVVFVTSSPTWDPRTRHSTLSAVHARTGALLFERRVPELLGRPHAAGDAVWSLADHREVRSFDARSGDDLACATLSDVAAVDWLRVSTAGALFGASQAQTVRTALEHATRQAWIAPEVGAPREFTIAASDYVGVPALRSAHGRVGWLVELGSDAKGQPAAVGGLTHLMFHRDIIAYRADGTVAWAGALPHDVVRAQVQQGQLLLALETGDWLGLDASTGTIQARGVLGVRPASIAFAGIAPTDAAAAGEQPPVAPHAALRTIAVDPDTRLLPARRLAVDALSRLGGAEATAALLAVARAPATPATLRRYVIERLATGRTEPEPLLDALAEHYDFLDATSAPPLDILLPALVTLRERRALPALEQRLMDPATPEADLTTCVRALAAIGGSDARSALLRFLHTYHADSALSADPSSLLAAADVLLGTAVSAQGLERFTGPRTQPALARAIAQRLQQARQAVVVAAVAAPASAPPVAPSSAVASAVAPKAASPRRQRVSPLAFWALSEARAPEPSMIPRGDPWWKDQNPLFISVEPIAAPARAPMHNAAASGAAPAPISDKPTESSPPSAWWEPVSPSP